MASHSGLTAYDTDFKQAILTACYDALVQEGFSAFRRGHVDWAFGDGFNGWVGLNTGLYADRVEVNPCVGIHCVQIEKFWTSLIKNSKKIKYDRAISTYSVQFGTLCPDEKAFIFTSLTDIPEESRRLAKLYSKKGLDFSKSLASYAALGPLLKSRVSTLGAYPERYASCLFLMGKREEAIDFVGMFLRTNPTYFRPFAESFEKQCKSSLND